MKLKLYNLFFLTSLSFLTGERKAFLSHLWCCCLYELGWFQMQETKSRPAFYVFMYVYMCVCVHRSRFTCTHTRITKGPGSNRHCVPFKGSSPWMSTSSVVPSARLSSALLASYKLKDSDSKSCCWVRNTRGALQTPDSECCLQWTMSVDRLLRQALRLWGG